MGRYTAPSMNNENTPPPATLPASRNGKPSQLRLPETDSESSPNAGKLSPLSARAERRLNRETNRCGLAEDSEIGTHWQATLTSLEGLREEKGRLDGKVEKLKGKVRGLREDVDCYRAQLNEWRGEAKRLQGEVGAYKAQLKDSKDAERAMEKEMEELRKRDREVRKREDEWRHDLAEAQAEIERMEEYARTGDYPGAYGQQPDWQQPYRSADRD